MDAFTLTDTIFCLSDSTFWLLDITAQSEGYVCVICRCSSFGAAAPLRGVIAAMFGSSGPLWNPLPWSSTPRRQQLVC